MKKFFFNFLFLIFSIGFCSAEEDLYLKNSFKKVFSFESGKVFVQIGHIDEFVLDQGYPFKKQSAYGHPSIQQGKLEEFVLDNGYPSKIAPGQIINTYKIIGEY
tara:strand:- start:289 stop:600 length:312 start_codon:yes stop_codon:yes gene_type:complete